MGIIFEKLILGSPEPLAQAELLWSLDVRCPSSTIASKDISFLTIGWILTKFGMNDPIVFPGYKWPPFFFFLTALNWT